MPRPVRVLNRCRRFDQNDNGRPLSTVLKQPGQSHWPSSAGIRWAALFGGTPDTVPGSSTHSRVDGPALSVAETGVVTVALTYRNRRVLPRRRTRHSEVSEVASVPGEAPVKGSQALPVARTRCFDDIVMT